MPTTKLTAAALPRLKPRADGTRETYWDTVLPGLYVRVSEKHRSFGVWTRVKGTGRPVRVTLGKYKKGVYDLADARDAARKVLHTAAIGNDPVVQKRQPGTVGDLVSAFLKDQERVLRPRTHDAWKKLLMAERLAGLRAKKPTEVTRGDLVRLFDRIRDTSFRQGGKGYSANRTFEVVRRVFSWAVQKDLVPAPGPCTGIVKPAKEQRRDRSYTSAELAAIIGALDDSAMCDGIRLCLYTGVRIQQALETTWAEFDGDVWVMPADRTGNKSGVAWRVPLTAPALAVLKRRRNDSDYVFPTRKGGPVLRDQKAIERLRKRSGVADFRPHDLRRTLMSWLASIGTPYEVRHAVLGHRAPGLEQTYNVHAYEKEKRAALVAWARYLKTVGQPAKVLPGVFA